MRNAVLGCQILALGDPALARRLQGLKQEMVRGVEARDGALQERRRGKLDSKSG